jgi:hypothetical protein
MKKILVATVVVCALIGLGLGEATLGNGGVRGTQPGMMVSPQTIVLAKVATVTVHTNITETRVADGTVTLDGVAPLEVWADDCGDLAARFAVADLGLVPGDVTLTLSGDYAAGGTFTATDLVRVK